MKANRSYEYYSFCRISGHGSDDCLLNPESFEWKSPKKANSIKTMKALPQKGKQTMKMEFGSFVLVKNSAMKENSTPCPNVYLVSRASVSMFESSSESTSESYKTGYDGFVQLLAGNKFREFQW